MWQILPLSQRRYIYLYSVILMTLLMMNGQKAELGVGPGIGPYATMCRLGSKPFTRRRCLVDKTVKKYNILHSYKLVSFGKGIVYPPDLLLFFIIPTSEAPKVR